MWAVIGSLLWFLVFSAVVWILFRWAGASLPRLRDLYLLRIPILTVASVWGFCLAAAFLPGARALLSNAFDLMGGAFDVGPGLGISWATMLFFMVSVNLVSLSACLLGSVVMVTWRLVRLYGPRRFLSQDPAKFNPNIELRHLTIFLPLIAVPVVTLALYKSVASSALPETSASEAIIAAALGITAAVVGALLSVVLLWLTNLAQRYWTRRPYASRPEDAPASTSDIVGKSPDFFVPTAAPPAANTLMDRARRHRPKEGLARKATAFVDRLLPEDAKPGYLERTEDGKVLILPGHVAAGVLLILTFLVYLAIGVLVYAFAYHTNLLTLSFVPTLCYLLLLAMLLCWALSGLAFFFDRYRIPVLLPLLAVLLVASAIGPDYYYPTVPQQANTETGESGSAGANDDSPDTMIVVAANGGGIQAAAWTARVLTGLEQDCRETPECGQDFGREIRLISSVSGGSAGTMYFLNEYQEDGTLPEKGLDEIVTRAEGSSLDHIAWGLLYPDLARTVNVLFPWVQGPFGLDRGQTLDKAWLREDMAWPRRQGIEQGLSRWQEDAAAGRRPGVIFNTTIAETGQRLPLSTVTLPEDVPGGIRYKRLLEGIDPKPTIPVVTAARLSAAFPYVSPAARAKEPPGTKVSEDGFHEDHIVDGGYYDNFGTSSLVEWLDWELTRNPTQRPERVLVVQIIASSSADDLGPRGAEGWSSERLDRILYQAIAPAGTVLNVRGAGQRTHSAVELELLSEKWDESNPCVAISRVPFEFDGPEPPLSWHLTQRDRLELATSWQSKSAERDRVIEFLTDRGEGCG